MSKLVKEEVHGGASIGDLHVLKAVVEEVGIEQVHEEGVVRDPVLGDDEEEGSLLFP